MLPFKLGYRVADEDLDVCCNLLDEKETQYAVTCSPNSLYHLL